MLHPLIRSLLPVGKFLTTTCFIGWCGIMISQAQFASNWVGVKQVMIGNSTHYIVISQPSQDGVIYHRELPNLQTGDCGIDTLARTNGEMYATMAEQAWASAPGQEDEMSQFHTWTLYATQDLVAANDPLGLDVISGWIPVASKSQETTGGAGYLSPFRITFDAGPFQDLMFLKLGKQ